jgi:hypothetical protein
MRRGVLGTAGLRSAASLSKASAKGRVRTYPAAYTARTAAEPAASRLFATFFFEPPGFISQL